jgi:signal transduction histidine kinase
MHLGETIPDELQDGAEGDPPTALEQLPSHGDDLGSTSLGIFRHLQGEDVIEESRQFETFLASLSTTLMHAQVGEIAREIETGLRRVVEVFGFDCVTLAEFSEDLTTLHGKYRWGAPEVIVPPLAPSALHLTFPWYAHQLRQGNTVFFARPGTLPAAAVAEKQRWQSIGLQSLLAIPFFMGEWGTYIISFTTFRSQRVWPEMLVARLRLIGEICVSALIRKHSGKKLETHLMFGTLVAELSARFAKVPTSDIDQAIQGGLQYVVESLDLDRSSLLEFSADQTELHATHSYAVPGVRAFVRTCPLHQEFPWFTERLRRGEIVRLRRLEELPEEAVLEQQSGMRVGIKSNLVIPVSVSGARICAIGFGSFRREIDWPAEWMPYLHLIGELFANALMRKRAEEASRRLWHELAHAARVAMLGELSASVAHELNQPLAAILSNAQAAQRFLTMGTPDVVEVQGALTDIIADDQRAGKIIQQLRALGKKEALERAPLHVNTLVQEVVHLVHSDALARHVTIALDLAAELPVIYGERIQLQQVILNLVLNAFEAIQPVTDHPRRLLIRTTCVVPCPIVVSCQDTGVGVDEATLTSMFSSFFTTKAEGMGMGLAISRAIIEAHGGRIWATPNPDRGITVWFTLPTGHQAGG